MNIKNKNTLEYKTGVDFKILTNLNMLLREAKELQLNELETSMLEHFLNGFDEYMDYYIKERRDEGKEIYFEKIEKSLNVLKAYLAFSSDGKISVFLKLYDGSSSNESVLELLPDLHKQLEEFFHYESSNLRKFRFSKCTIPFLHILQQGHRPFEKYIIRDIKACITFPFVKGQHERYAKIYAHTMKWVADPSDERLINMGHVGNFYDIDIDIENLLDRHNSECLDYPTCEFFYRDEKIKLHDVAWICKIYNAKVILRCNENLFTSSFEDLNENILNYPPCDLSYLMIEIYGDLEYFMI